MTDTETDRGTDTGTDTGTGTGADSGTGTGADSGTGTGTDSGTDTGNDVRTDTGTGTDPIQPKLQPLFLERQSYRRRRLMDAARLLPVVGALLFAVPLLWTGVDSPGAGEPMPTSRAMLYIFTAWGGLILATVWFGFRTRGWNRTERLSPETPGQNGQGAG